MIHYDFYLDQEGVLCCKNQNETSLFFRGKEANKKLRELDNSFLTNVQLSKESILLETDLGIARIPNTIILEKYNETPHILTKMKYFISLEQKKKHRERIVRNQRLVGVTSAIGGLALIALIGTCLKKEDRKAISVSPDKIVVENPKELEETNELESSIGTILVHTNLEKQIVEIDSTTYLDFSCERDSITGNTAYERCHQLIEDEAPIWGLDSRLLMAMATQESAGIGDNLMQIEFNAWKYKDENSIITVYNFEKEQYQNFVFSNQPSDFVGKNMICITEESLKDPKINVQMACVIFRKNLEYMKYHIGAAIQCYNFGYGNMQRALNYAAVASNISVEDILYDQQNLTFMNYTAKAVENQKEKGDYLYLNHIMRYLELPEEEITIKVINSFGEINDVCVTILPSNEKGKKM